MRGRCLPGSGVHAAGTRSVSANYQLGGVAPPLPKENVRPARCNGRRKLKATDMAKVAFLGLGVMGFPMAGHLVTKGGHEVTVFNRTPAKAKAWAEKFGGRTGSTPAA